MKQIVVGIDIGGTNVKMGLVSYNGKILSRTRFETKTFVHNKNHLIDVLVEKIVDLIDKRGFKKKDILGIGIGLPGLIDASQGVVRMLPNIPGWRNVPLKKILESRLGIPTYIDNDVNVIALGEWKFGAGRGEKNMVCITLGTGVGSGLILDNRLYRGEGFAAGELGHMPLNETGPACNCGGFGCFEKYVGNRTLLQRIESIMGRPMKIQDMYRLARAGNRKALKFWEETAVHIGNGLVGVVNLLNPTKIVIGGGVANNYRFLYKTIKTVLRRRAMPVQASMVTLSRARLLDHAGIVGAQVLVHDAQ